MIRPGTAQEKQGDLSDLNKKTKAELIDLLTRQEKLLANRKFLSRLQDRGAKVESLAEKLRMLIKEREEVDRAAQLFEKMDLGQEDSTISHVTERTSVNHLPVPAKITVIEDKNAESDALSNSGDSTSPARNVKEEKRGKFKPNKDLKSTVIPDDLPRPSVEPQPSTVGGQSSQKHRSSPEQRDAELSSAVVPPLRNQEAQVVEFLESANLLEEQKKHAEALVAKQAAERLTERLHIQMGDFLPQVQQGSYRSGEADSDNEESEDEEDDEEVSDGGGEEDGD